MKIHEGTGDELEATARLPVLDEPEEHCDPGETGTWSSGEGAFAQFGSAQRSALQAEIAARDTRADQLQARLDESEAWARQLALELERLRAVQGANPPAEARLAEAQTQRAHWEAAAGEAWAQLAESETAAGEVRAQLTEAETAAGELRARLAEAETAAGEVRVQLAEEQAGTSEARSQLALSQAAVSAIRAELQHVVDERDAVRAQMDCDHAELERLRAAAPGARSGSAAALRREIRSQQLRIDTLLEQLRSQEALRRFSGDLRRAGDTGAEPAQVEALRRQVAELEARIAEGDAAVAAALDRARIAEGACTHAEESARSRQGELEARIAVLEGAVVASARELETLRQREQQLADELMAARRPQPAAATAAPAPTVEPGVADSDYRAPVRRLADLTAELERRDHRIEALQVENAAQAEALRAIRRGLGLLGGERPPAAGDPEVAPRWLTRLDDGSNRLHVLRSARCTVGRTPHSDVEVPESYVSRSHAVFRLGPDAAIVEDAGSANGVFVNDVRVRRQLLKDGDSVGFGKARYRFHTSHPSE